MKSSTVCNVTHASSAGPVNASVSCRLQHTSPVCWQTTEPSFCRQTEIFLAVSVPLCKEQHCVAVLRRQIDEVHTVELQGIQDTLASGGTRAARKGQSRRACPLARAECSTVMP